MQALSMLIDSHCHINSDELWRSADALVARAAEAGVGRMLLVGCDLRNSVDAVEMAHRFALYGTYASVGIHPHEAQHYVDGLPQDLADLAADVRVVALGEMGLDYYYDHSPRDVQRDVFEMQLEWAERADKPVVLHIRDAMPDALAILRKRARLRLLFHCYSGGLDFLDEVLDLGAWCAIGGAVTWKRNDELRQVAARIPDDRLLLETDCPWMAPIPFRGKLNEPAYVRYVYDTVARVRGVSPERLAGQVVRSAALFFGAPFLGGEAGHEAGCRSGCESYV